jgi:hypothetical protein
MRHQLKHYYGRRITPGVKILILVAIVFFGLHLAFGASGYDARKTHADELIVEPPLRLTAS